MFELSRVFAASIRTLRKLTLSPAIVTCVLAISCRSKRDLEISLLHFGAAPTLRLPSLKTLPSQTSARVSLGLKTFSELFKNVLIRNVYRRFRERLL
jgi:hypothetical protein